MSESVYYMAISPRYFTNGDAKLHIVDGLRATTSLCGRRMFGPYETTVIEDKEDPWLCKKCAEKMPWEEVRGKTKDYLEV